MVKLDKLKGIRREKKVTYRKGAEVTDCSLTTVSKKMNGKSQFTLEDAEKLSNYLELPNDMRCFIFLE